MSLNTIQTFLKNTLDGLQAPGQQGQQVQCFIAPPSNIAASGPIVFVWGSSVDAARQTAPRVQGQGTGGYMKWAHLPDIWVYLEIDPDIPDQATRFPLLIDSVIATLQAVPIPTFLTDPVTGGRSQLLSCAERFSIIYQPTRSTASERLYIYQAQLKVRIEETVMS
jgi:hypothetical protein